MSRKKEKALNPDHLERINKAIIFIDDHLDDELLLDKIAGVAAYSPFHFHRIFKAVIKEPLNSYISRKRIEKAAAVLMRKKEITVTQLSVKYGFNGNSSFTRAFKKFYGMSPSAFRNNCPDQFSKISQADSKNGQALVHFEKYICDINNQQKMMDSKANIEIKEMPAMKLAYISHIGHNNLRETFGRLLDWSGQKGLLRSAEVKFLTIYHDSFKITAPEKVRMSACILLREPVKTEGEIGLKTIDQGKFIVGHFELSPQEVGKTWSDLFVWLKSNGYKTTDRNCFEIYHSDPDKHPEKKFIMDLCIPID